MAEPQIWVVWGGVFTDMTFTRLEEGKEEFYGPFHDEESAIRRWREGMARFVDIASHRLFVLRARQG